MKKEIKNEWTYEQSPKEVWAYLTQAELIAQWLMPNTFKAIPGYEFQFNSGPIPSMDLDGIFHCTIIEIVPYQKLVYTWKGGPGNGVITLDTVVEWTLQKQGEGTKLSIKQSGFKESNYTIFTAMTAGWQEHALKMMKLLNEGENDNGTV